MIRSMTGFGASEGSVGGARVSVELRTVNHRYFNPSLKLPFALARWETDAREHLRKHIARGHVTVSARVERPGNGAATIDQAKFAYYATELRALRDRNGLGGEVDVAAVLRMPDVLHAAQEDVVEGTVEEFLSIVEFATNALMQMREAEGGRLAAVVTERLGVVEEALGRIEVRAPERVVAQRDRLRENVRVLTGGIAVDEQRLAQEIAILADRLDVGEEIDRFRAHVAAFRDVLSPKDREPVGKRLWFILQEMLRE